MSTERRYSYPDQPLERLRYLLEINYQNRVPNEELAQRLNLSLPQLKRYFQVMVQKGLLAEDIRENEPGYRITPHGQSFIESYQRIQQVLLK
jgi:predicted transcriptional regulator